MNINLINIDEEIARKAYQLRAQYPFLKGMDALQIATSLIINCDKFITNDKKLKTIQEITVIILDEI